MAVCFRFRLRKQWDEVLGPVNRWFCSQAHGQPIDDPEMLWIHFIRNGGAADFAMRFDHAMSPNNRWYCSEFYRREIRDPEILWNYYMAWRLPDPTAGRDPMPMAQSQRLDIAC